MTRCSMLGRCCANGCLQEDISRPLAGVLLYGAVGRRHCDGIARGNRLLAGVARKPHRQQKRDIHRGPNCLRADWVLKIRLSVMDTGVRRNEQSRCSHGRQGSGVFRPWRVGRAQQAKSAELRASISIARRWRTRVSEMSLRFPGSGLRLVH